MNLVLDDGCSSTVTQATVAYLALSDPKQEAGNGIDSNQSLFAQRWAEARLAENSHIDLDDVYEAARDLAMKSMPTAKQCAMSVVEMRNGPTYCYMAFFGLAGIGRYVKIGRSKHPEGRVYGLTTGNPLDLMGIYACKFPTRSVAHAVEQSLLRALRPISRRGEWVEVEPFDTDSMRDVARNLSGAALTPQGARPNFELLWTARIAA